MARIIEALVFVSDRPLPREKMQEVLKGVDDETITAALNSMHEKFNNNGSALMLSQVAGGYRFQTKSRYSHWLQRLTTKKARTRLGKPAMESLAIIAYKQPATRAEIDSIRGVDSSSAIRVLLEKKLVEVKGRKNVPGKPMLYGTSEQFLFHLGLNSLEELPSVADIRDIT
ncbi:SMC-Scp complex subunit ScpB [Candidatus Hydrogenedentota bacterium]